MAGGRSSGGHTLHAGAEGVKVGGVVAGGLACAQSSTGQPACLGCSSWPQFSPRSPSLTPAPGTALSSLQRALQVRARTWCCWPGGEVVPGQPLPHHTLLSPGATRSQPPVAHAGQVYGEQPPKKLEAASEGKVQGPGQPQGGALGQLPGSATAWPVPLTGQAHPSVGLSVCVCSRCLLYGLCV